MDQLAQRRAQDHLDTLLWYLFECRACVTETTAQGCERYVDSVNAFFNTEAFSCYEGPQKSIRIACNCGWSLSPLLPERPIVQEASALALFEKGIRRMVLHRETQHGGLKESKWLP